MTDEKPEDIRISETDAPSEDADESRTPFVETTIVEGSSEEGDAAEEAGRSGVVNRHVLDDRYELVRLLGRGGMGSVFEAYDQLLGETVALKTLDEQYADDAEAVGRFRREVRLARRVTHRNVARTHAFGTADGVPYLTMEYLDGEPLSARIGRYGPFSVAEAVGILQGIAAGLGAAHESGILHRDLKPGNVLLSQQGRVVLSDFGIAAIKHAGSQEASSPESFEGTPRYVSPEQVRGNGVLDERADLYALGLIGFEMLTGEVPWEGDSALEVAMARVENPPPDPGARRSDLAVPLRELILDCLATRPVDRVASTEAFLGRLDDLDVSPTVDAVEAPGGGGPPSASLAVDRSSTRPPTGSLSAAVMPLKNRGGDVDEYVPSVVSDELIDELAMRPGLRVRPPGAEPADAQQTESGQSPVEYGRQVDVDVVVAGSLRRRADDWLLRVSMTSVKEGFQIWSERFEVPAEGLLEAVVDVADAVADASTAGRPEQNHSVLTDPNAIDLYLRARHEAKRQWFDDLSGAWELFETLLDRVPEDPRVLTGAATVRARMAYLDDGPRRDHVDAALELADRAESVSDRGGEAQFARAMALYYQGSAARALKAVREAVDVAPNYADAHDLAGRLLLEIGSLTEAAEHLRTARQLNPALDRASWDLSRGYGLMGDAERARAAVERDVESTEKKGIQQLHHTRLQMWGLLEPESTYSPVFDDVLQDARWLEAMDAFVQTGDFPEETREVLVADLESVQSGTRRALIYLQVLAELMVLDGDLEAGMTFLRRGADTGLIDVNWVEKCPALEPLRGRDGFERAREMIRENAGVAG